MGFALVFTKEASEELDDLSSVPHLQKQCKAVKKALGLLENNLRHPSLHTHKYKGMKGINGGDVFEAYAENSTFKAYRIFWEYGPPTQRLTILSILPHP